LSNAAERATTWSMQAESDSAGSRRAAAAGRWIGPLLFLGLFLLPTGSLAGDAKTVAAVVAWMALWWVSDAAPLAATALLPLVLFPLLGVRAVGDVAPRYGDDMVFLFFGGFVVALAVESAGLHRRLAVAILLALGTSARRLVWAFLLVTAGMSMWLSNTATTLMMLPIAAGVVERTGATDRVPSGPATRIFLAIAYGASIGGLATLIGTPTNVVLAGMAPSLVPGLAPLTFGGWMLFGVPLVAALLPLAGLLLARGLPGDDAPGVADVLRREHAALGPVSPPERRAALLFCVTAVAWVTRARMDLGAFALPGWSQLLDDPNLVGDAVPAVAAAIAATIIPRRDSKGGALVSWNDIQHGVPWGALLLFGGGFAIADGMHSSGLDTWLASRLDVLAALPFAAMILAVCLVSMAATELTSNTAVATLLLPIMAAIAGPLGVPPYLLMVPTAVACSCAFMLPVATPPNAIVIGSGHVTARDLLLEGLRLNALSALLITALVLTLGRAVLP
jgi:sodium-dependent dicarboxylate transporter 2/3/5